MGRSVPTIVRIKIQTMKSAVTGEKNYTNYLRILSFLHDQDSKSSSLNRSKFNEINFINWMEVAEQSFLPSSHPPNKDFLPWNPGDRMTSPSSRHYLSKPARFFTAVDSKTVSSQWKRKLSEWNTYRYCSDFTSPSRVKERKPIMTINNKRILLH